MFKISATDPDTDLNWDIDFEILYVTDDKGEDLIDKFETTGSDCTDSRRCSIGFKKKGEIYSSCLPENDENCDKTTPRVNFMRMKVRAKGTAHEYSDLFF